VPCGLEAQEGELVRPIQKETATEEEPYRIVNAGAGTSPVVEAYRNHGLKGI
jgi:hypothetical protein